MVSCGCRKPDLQASYSDALNKFRQGDSDAAFALASTGYKQAEKRDPVWSWRFRILKAEVLLHKHAPENSLELLAPTPPPDLPVEIIARKMIVEAQALCNSNKTGDPKALLADADHLISDNDQVLRAEMEYVRGDCAFPTNRSLARDYFLSSAKLAHGHDGYVEARALGDAAWVLMQAGHYDEAIKEFTAALAATDSPLLREGLLGDLGECHQELGDWRAAASLSQEAEDVASGVKDAVTDRGRWLIDLGRVHFSQLEYSEANAALSKALSIANELRDADLKVRSLDNLSLVALTTGDRANAERHIREMEALHPEGEQHLYLLLNKAKLARLDNNFRDAEELLKQLLAGNPDPRIRSRAQSDLGSIYVSQQKFDAAERAFREAMTAAEEVFIELKSDQGRISFLDYYPFYDQYVRFLVMRNRPLDALSIAERGRSRALAQALGFAGNQGSQINLPRIQNALRTSRQVVFAYWLGWETESYLWVITPSQMKLFKLPAEMEIVREIDAYDRNIIDRTSEESSRGQKLFQMLVAPAEGLIPKGSNIIIVPHRRLAKLNFETLVSPEAKPHYWIEDVCIQSASFLALLESPKRARARYSKELLLMGAPVEASKDFPGLEHASEEMGKVAGRFSPAKEAVIAGAEATPAAYRSSDPSQFRYFHFVTHGTASDTNPLDSAIILSPSQEGYKLYARDIIKTKIHPDLVTISTCYGAGTRQYSGEGLVGLAWAFMRAGAHEVIAALWEADDEANAQLMDWFYAGLAKGNTPAAALRDAKLKMLHSGNFHRAPYFWAPLQVYTGP